MDVDTREELAEATALLETAKVSIDVGVPRLGFLCSDHSPGRHALTCLLFTGIA